MVYGPYVDYGGQYILYFGLMCLILHIDVICSCYGFPGCCRRIWLHQTAHEGAVSFLR